MGFLAKLCQLAGFLAENHMSSVKTLPIGGVFVLDCIPRKGRGVCRYLGVPAKFLIYNFLCHKFGGFGIII